MSIFDDYVDFIDEHFTDLQFLIEFNDLIQKHLIQQRFAIMVFENTNFKKTSAVLTCLRKQLAELEDFDEFFHETVGYLPPYKKNEYGIEFISITLGNHELSPTLVRDSLETYLNLQSQKEGIYEFISCYTFRTIHRHRINVCSYFQSLLLDHLNELEEI